MDVGQLTVSQFSVTSSVDIQKGLFNHACLLSDICRVIAERCWIIPNSISDAMLVSANDVLMTRI